METKLRFEYRPIQLPMRDFLWSVKRGALWAAMGSGKTSALLDFIIRYQAINPDPVWVVGPPNVVRDTWPKEVERFSNFNGLVYSVVSGDRRTRERAMSVNADIYIVNYDVLKWLWNEYFLTDHSRKISILIGDEATRLRGFRLRKCKEHAKHFYLLSRRADRLVELTGTPAPNGLMDLWGQVFILDKGERLGTTIDAYRQRWFTCKANMNYMRYEPQPYALDQITEKVKGICKTVRVEDYYELEKIVEQNVYVDLPADLRQMYKEAHREMIVKLQDKKILIQNRADLTNKCLQIANGAIYTGGDKAGNPTEHTKEWEQIHERKIEALASIIEECNGENILVAYHYTFEKTRLQKAFAKYITVFDSCNGPDKIAAWNAGKVRLFAVNASAVGHGLNLQWGGRIIVFFNNWWNMDQREQLIGRIGPMRQFQAGFKRSVLQFNIVTRGTVDERVLYLHEHKCDINDAILSGAV